MLRVQLKENRRYKSIGAKKRKYKTAQVENKTLPNFKPIRSLIIRRYGRIYNRRSGDKNFGFAIPYTI